MRSRNDPAAFNAWQGLGEKIVSAIVKDAGCNHFISSLGDVNDGEHYLT